MVPEFRYVPVPPNVPRLLLSVAPELMLSVPLSTTDPVFATVVPERRTNSAGAPMVRVWLLVKLVSPSTPPCGMVMFVEPSGTPRLHSPALLKKSITLAAPCHVLSCPAAGWVTNANPRQKNTTGAKESLGRTRPSGLTERQPYVEGRMTKLPLAAKAEFCTGPSLAFMRQIPRNLR